MQTYQPRKRIALDIESVQDPEVKELLENISQLQKEMQGLNNGLDSQVAAGVQEAQAMINKMNKVNQEFEQMLDAVKSQVHQLTNAALQYVQINSSGLQEEQPKFRDSFVYITKNAISNIKKLIDGIKTQVGDVLQVLADSSPIEVNMTPEQEDAVDMTPENLLTSSIIAAKNVLRQRIAALLPAVMKTIEKIEPIVNQGNAVNVNTEKLITQLNEVIGTIPQAQAPVVEETEAFSPDISPEEVDEAAGLEEDMNLEEPAAAESAPLEDVPAAEQTPEEAADDIVEDAANKETAEPAAEDEEIDDVPEPEEDEEIVEDDEAIDEEKETPLPEEDTDEELPEE